MVIHLFVLPAIYLLQSPSRPFWCYCVGRFIPDLVSFFLSFGLVHSRTQKAYAKVSSHLQFGRSLLENLKM